VQRLFASPSFRVYTTDDVVGVEIGGALKNVFAIAGAPALPSSAGVCFVSTQH
jgi:glycerol-3-phosphate dehydrogenase